MRPIETEFVGANNPAVDEINGSGKTPVIERPTQVSQQHLGAGWARKTRSHLDLDKKKLTAGL